MRRWLLLLLLLSSCVAKPIISTTACNDPLYVKLKQKPIEKMTPREFTYFQTKDRECEEARADTNAVEQLLMNPFTKPTNSVAACNDSLYLKLKGMPIDSMTDRQFAYYLNKDDECEAARATSNAITQLQIGQQKNAMLSLVFAGALALVLAVLLQVK